MNEKFSFIKMGMRFAASLNMGENFLDISYEVMYKMLGLNYNQYEEKSN